MPKLLVELLGVKEREFSQLIERLERVTLNSGIDIKLVAEIITKTREKARSLGLDTNDTTHKEFFHALKTKLQTDDEKLNKKLMSGAKKPEKIAQILADTTSKLSKNERVLALTNAGTKRVLNAVPPRKTLKALRLRSLDSVLKRENPKTLYALALQLEDASWQSQVHAKMKRLQSKDISWQPVEITALPKPWLDKTYAKISHHGIQLVCPDVGAVVVLPAILSTSKGATILAVGLILHAAQRLAVDSMPYRREGFLQGYDSILQEIAHGGHSDLASIHGLSPTWRAVHELMSKGYIRDITSEVELKLDELSWQSVEMKLASIVPEIDFWIDTHFLGLSTNEKPVSLHMLDVARAVITNTEYGSQPIIHLEGSLWNEIQVRYLQHDNLARSLSKQLRPIQEDMLL